MNTIKRLLKYIIKPKAPRTYIALGLGMLWVALFYFFAGGLRICPVIGFIGFGIFFILRGIINVKRITRQKEETNDDRAGCGK